MGKPTSDVKKPTNLTKKRRHKKQGFQQPAPGYIIPDRVRDDGVKPEVRLAEHRASRVHLGPDAGGRVRVALRNKMGGEKGAEAPLVRSLYDVANSRQQKRRRRRKGKNS